MLTLVVIYSFKHIETVLISRFSKETHRTIDNANMTRELSRILSEIDLIVRTFHDNDERLASDGKRLFLRIERMLEQTDNDEFRSAIQGLLSHFDALIIQCQTVNQTRKEIRSLEREFDETIATLDQIIAERLVDLIVEGDNTSDLEQLSSLIGGWRESFMGMKYTFIQLGLDHFKHPLSESKASESHVLFDMADDLLLRLRTLTTATPKVADSGKRLGHVLTRYKERIRAYHHDANRLESVIEENRLANETLMDLMAALDGRIAQDMVHAETELKKRITFTIQVNLFLFLVMLPIVFLGGWIAYSIRKPFQVTLETIRRLSEGDPPQEMTTSFEGEFEAIRHDLNRLIQTTHQVTEVAEKIAAGNLDLKISTRSDRDRLMQALDQMIFRLDGITSETRRMIQSVADGNLKVEGDLSGFEGGWRDLLIGINDLIGGLKREVATTTALAQEMALARNIQTALLPQANAVVHPEFEMAATMIPADQVGGDFYDILLDAAGDLRLAIGDVSGHGVTPGLIMMMAQTAHATVAAKSGRDARDAVVMTNQVLYDNVHERLDETHFMTFLSLRYLGDGLFEHAGAHLRIVLYRSDQKRCELIPTQGIYLNFKREISKSIKNNYFSLDEKDILILYTDGLTEAKDSEDTLYDMERFVASIEKHAGLDVSVEKLNQLLMEEVMVWCEGKKEDDMTLLVIKRKGLSHG